VQIRIISSLLLIIFVSCSNQNTDNKPPASNGSIEFFSDVFRYNITIPDDFKPLTNQNQANSLLKNVLGEFFRNDILYEAVFVHKENNKFPFIILSGKDSYFPENFDKIVDVSGAFVPEKPIEDLYNTFLNLEKDSMTSIIDVNRKMMFISNDWKYNNEDIKSFIAMCFGKNRLISISLYYNPKQNTSLLQSLANIIESFSWEKGAGFGEKK
jgi:hypothetical protein